MSSLTLYSKTSLLSLHHRIRLCDEDKHVWYYAKSAILTFTNKTTIYNANRQKVATIRRKLVSFHRAYKITMRNGLSFTMSKELLHVYRDVIDIKDLGWQCRGNIFELNFTVLDRHNRKLAAIKQKMVSMHDKYKIEVYDTTHLDMIITLLITLQHMVIDEEKEKRS